MSETLSRVQQLIAQGEVQISKHGYDELSADGLSVAEILAGVSNAEAVENCPEYPKGPCVLVLQADRHGKLIHVLRGISKGANSPAVLVTAYRPEPGKWSPDFRTRR